MSHKLYLLQKVISISLMMPFPRLSSKEQVKVDEEDEDKEEICRMITLQVGPGVLFPVCARC